jgi:hypothetical protein
MTTQEAIKLIEEELHPYFKRVPKPLLNRIHNIIKGTKTLIHREVPLLDQVSAAPNLQNEWVEICKLNNVDPTEAKEGRVQSKVRVRTHFVRHIISRYENVTLQDIGTFLGRDHSTVIHMRDRCKAACALPPFYKRRFTIIPENV